MVSVNQFAYSSITSELVMVNDTTVSQRGSNNQNSLCIPNNFRNAVMEASTKSLSHMSQDDGAETSVGSPDTSLSGPNMGTTLELHPNVILGIGDDEAHVSTTGVECDRPFMCPICQASYKTKTHLRRHMNIHMSSRPFSCGECGKGFNRKEHLNKHMEAVHSGNRHNCPYCNKSISRLDHLRRHIKNMHMNSGEKTASPTDKSAILKLEIRNKKQKAQFSFRNPRFQTGTIGQTIITPIPAFSASTSEGKMSASVERNVSGSPTSSSSKPGTTMTIIPSNILGPGEAVATLAVQSTPTQKVLVHQRLQSSNNIDLTTATNNISNLADLSLSLGENFSLVINERESKDSSSHQKSESFNCRECGSTFSNDEELAIHSKSHKPTPFRCPDCSRCYTRREKLTEHIRCVHEGQKFSCEYCGKELSRKDHVLRHIRSVHPEVFAETFAEMDESQIVMDHHGRLVSIGVGRAELSNTPKKKKRNSRGNSFTVPSLGDVGALLRSVCHVCLKVFGSAYHLTRHIESCHNGDARPFTCTACNKMFKRKDHLAKHVKAHCPSMKQGHTQSSQQNVTDFTQKAINMPELMSQDEKVGISSEDPDDGDMGMLSEGSASSSDCQHTILQNLQVEMDVSQTEDDRTSVMSKIEPSADNSVGGILLGGPGMIKHSAGSTSIPTTNGEYSLPVIDTYMQGGVNVVVVDEEISNFLLQSSSTHLTTTFPCAQCQKEFPQRDQLIAHALQEHSADAVHHSHISDISFSDF